jgi:hypothetical protein
LIAAVDRASKTADNSFSQDLMKGCKLFLSSKWMM